jgi:hypothetical protein
MAGPGTAVDIVDSPVGPAPPNTTRIASPGGVLSASHDGGPYAPIGAGGGGGNTITIDDAGTNNQPDAFLVRHTTSGTAAVDFGLTTDIVELEAASGNVLRVGKTVYREVAATPDASVYVRADHYLLSQGLLAPFVAYQFIAGSALNPFMAFGDPTTPYGIARATNQMQIFVGDLAINFTTAQAILTRALIMSGRAIQGNRSATPTAVATTITLPTDGNMFPLTAGAGTLNSIVATGWQAGTEIILDCAAGITITHNTAGTGATILTSSLASIVTSGTGRAVRCCYNGTNWLAQA